MAVHTESIAHSTLMAVPTFEEITLAWVNNKPVKVTIQFASHGIEGLQTITLDRVIAAKQTTKGYWFKGATLKREIDAVSNGCVSYDTIFSAEGLLCTIRVNGSKVSAQFTATLNAQIA